MSHDAAVAAQKAGYTNIRIFAKGFSEWLLKGNAAEK
jgi:rhodanese-related sulfurtransferase